MDYDAVRLTRDILIEGDIVGDALLSDAEKERIIDIADVLGMHHVTDA